MTQSTKRKGKAGRFIAPQERTRLELLKNQRRANSQERAIAQHARTLERLIVRSRLTLVDLARAVCADNGFVMLRKDVHEELEQKGGVA